MHPELDALVALVEVHGVLVAQRVREDLSRHQRLDACGGFSALRFCECADGSMVLTNFLIKCLRSLAMSWCGLSLG